MKRQLLALLLACPALSLANSNDCPATKATALPNNTTVFAYQAIKNKNTYYIPFAAMVDGKLIEGYNIQLPANTMLYNLRNDQATKVQFKNEHDNVDYNTCRSIGKVNGITSTTPTVFATVPMAKEFNFTPDAGETTSFMAKNPSVFSATSKPCKDHQPHYDKNGVMTCYADALVAISNLNNGKQYWHTKQYRHDVGFAVSVPEGKTMRQVVEDCAVCKD